MHGISRAFLQDKPVFEEIWEELVAFIRDFGITDLVSMAVPPGMSAEQMAPSLERLFRDVVPEVKRIVGSGLI